jgi:hypothetical protein
MSTQFWPCPGCSRHVKRGDAICPFCRTAPSVDIPTRVLSGRLSRAALFAAGAVGVGIASTECAPSVTTEYGCPVPNCAFETEDANASDGPSAAAPDAADASAATGPTDSSSAADVPMAVPFYGAAMPP